MISIHSTVLGSAMGDILLLLAAFLIGAIFVWIFLSTKNKDILVCDHDLIVLNYETAVSENTLQNILKSCSEYFQITQRNQHEDKIYLMAKAKIKSQEQDLIRYLNSIDGVQAAVAISGEGKVTKD